MKLEKGRSNHIMTTFKPPSSKSYMFGVALSVTTILSGCGENDPQSINSLNQGRLLRPEIKESQISYEHSEIQREQRRKNKLQGEINDNYTSLHWKGWGAIKKATSYIKEYPEEKYGYSILEKIKERLIHASQNDQNMDAVFAMRYLLKQSIKELAGDNSDEAYNIALQKLEEILGGLSIYGNDKEDQETLIAFLYRSKLWTQGGGTTDYNVIDECANYIQRYRETDICDSYIPKIRKQLQNSNNKENKWYLNELNSKLVRHFLGDQGKGIPINTKMGKYLSFVSSNDSPEEISLKIATEKLNALIEKDYENLQYTTGETNVLSTLLDGYDSLGNKAFIYTQLERLVIQLDNLNKEYNYGIISRRGKRNMKRHLSDFIKTHPDPCLVAIYDSITI